MSRNTVSAIMLTLLLTSMLTLAFPIQPAKADGTSQINVDGSISPSTAPISSVRQVSRAFTGDIHESIDVQRAIERGIPSSTSLEQQPSPINGNVVASVTSFEAIRWQEKTFFAAGRYWLFYIDGDYPTESSSPTSTMYYTTSTDGVSWASPTALASGLDENSGENVQAFLSNSGYLQVFYRSSNELFYRMGSPNSDGSVTWATPSWQLVFNANSGGEASGTCDFFAITDSNNYPWVSWGYVRGPIRLINPSDTKMYVWKDAFNNGTWQTASGFPYNVGTGNYTNDLMVPLSNGQNYVMYFLDNPPLSGQIYGELWNGTAWGPQETCTTSQVYEQYVWGHESWDRTAVADSNNNIFLAFLSTALNLVFVKRTMSGGWNSETIVQGSCGDYSSPSFNLYNGNLRLFWISSFTSICYKKYVGGVWDTDPTLIVNETNSQIAIGATAFGTDDGRLNAFTMSLDGSIGLLWVNNQTVTNTGQIMFGLFQPQTAPTYSNIGLSSTVANSPCTFSCCWTDTEGLGTFIFSTNNTGNWQNDSTVSLSGTVAWTNVTKTLNPIVGTVVGYEWFAYNTNGNWASTGIQTLTTRALFHDVAVTNVASSRTVVGQGYGTNISVTVANQGDFPENFNVTTYANTTTAAALAFSLTSGSNQSKIFVWNTTGFAYGNCTLKAVADIVPGETDIADNNCTCGIPVHVGVPGDVSSTVPGVYDGVTNMKDVAYLVSLFNTKPSSPSWNPNADVNNDGVCNMRDIAIAVAYFNQHE